MQSINESSVFINETCVCKNGTCIYKNEGFVYSLLPVHNQFSIN